MGGRWLKQIGSGTVILVAAGLAALVIAILANTFGWVRAWNLFGVPSIMPPFRDLHAITDHAACAARGIDVYRNGVCDPYRLAYNYPPSWLALGRLGIDGSHTVIFGLIVAATALGTIIAFFRGRSVMTGIAAAALLLSPSILLGFERGNIDLVLLALVAAGALIYAERGLVRPLGTIVFVGAAIVLKLYPAFCINLMARFSRTSFAVAGALIAILAVYLLHISSYLDFIWSNTQKQASMSYGYLVPFQAVDLLYSQSGLGSPRLTETWAPMVCIALVLSAAVAAAAIAWRRGYITCPIEGGSTGTGFLFGSGIYCGTFLLGFNFAYRLIFLLLCLPQLLDWARPNSLGNDTRAIAGVLLGCCFIVCWLNGLPPVLLLAQLSGWILFGGLAFLLMLSFFDSVLFRRQSPLAASNTTPAPQ